MWVLLVWFWTWVILKAPVVYVCCFQSSSHTVWRLPHDAHWLLSFLNSPHYPCPGGSFPHSVRDRRSLPSRRRTDQAGESCPVHARGCPEEGRRAARPPQLALWHPSSHNTHRHSCPAEHHPATPWPPSPPRLDAGSRERGPPHIVVLAEVYRHILDAGFDLCSLRTNSLRLRVFKPSSTQYVIKSLMLVSMRENGLRKMFWRVTITAKS